MGRWVLHLPVALPRRVDAVVLVVALRDSLGHVPALDFGEATVSAEDDQSRRTRVWCDARLGGGQRCELPLAHDGGCR
ncbi:hypothetical protein GA0074692_4595 [Micromonospora pallida]|uniref:Uncharacterized protein n=1 Tax=Micromonospora pallida TaxID=145854 RepID=A0A1C6T6T1_9ACTN|nr:hypothetical protein [Micromonospora pallida]SCL37223.1 hypothetical protein GA0074692_4595 [Micromonospora pallida]